MNHLQQF